MKLTKLQRYTAYCIMLHESEINLKKIISHGQLYIKDSWGFCEMIERLTEGKIGVVDLPELLSRKPKYIEFSGRWWPAIYKDYGAEEGWEQRIAALKACIEETHP